MADVRELLRQQRAARRIEHPHAAYSDAGKLLCTVCHEQVRAESLWDGHVAGAGHQQRLHGLRAAGKASPNGLAAAAQPQKRKHGDDAADQDEDMADGLEEEFIRKKRSKTDIAAVGGGGGASSDASAKQSPTEAGRDKESQKNTPTPAPLLRRMSGAPAQGVEMQIPSRPATPVTGREGSSTGSGASVSSTPKLAPTGKSPLMPQGPMGTTASAAATGPNNAVTAAPAESPLASAPPAGQPTTTTRQAVDEDEWAAFEAEMIRGSATAAAATSATGGAVISAPAMSAEDVAKSQEEEQAKRRAAAEVELEDEREEATRALETEFEEMEELEARVRRLKERREALRLQGQGGGQAAPVAAGAADGLKGAGVPAEGKENANGGVAEDEEESEEEDDDDWDGFRFRG